MLNTIIDARDFSTYCAPNFI